MLEGSWLPFQNYLKGFCEVDLFFVFSDAFGWVSGWDALEIDDVLARTLRIMINDSKYSLVGIAVLIIGRF